MILTPCADFSRFHGLHRLFPVVQQWLDNETWRTLADGKHPLIGEDLFVILESGQTKDRDIRRFESHRRYLDVQVSLSGGEQMDWRPVTGCAVEDPFAPDGDIQFFSRASTGDGVALLVKPDWLTVFWPEDAHRPSLHFATGPAPYRKAVFKVALSAA